MLYEAVGDEDSSARTAFSVLGVLRRALSHTPFRFWARIHETEPKIVTSIEKSESTTLKCLGCGKIGVSVCARCAKSKGRILAARAYPLKERDPELYRRLSDLSQCPLEGNKQSWDEFCVEIGAEELYEHLPLLEEIVREGSWRTDALDPVKFIRKAFVYRVKRAHARLLPRKPKFDRRSGALITPGTSLFTEFEKQNSEGELMLSEAVVDGIVARKALRTAGEEYVVLPADRESNNDCRDMTFAEWREARLCELFVDMLEHDKPRFDAVLRGTITSQKKLVECMELDQDEAEVVAVISMLWSVGPRMYLKFLDVADRKRIRNAWDRLDRKRKSPQSARSFRKALRQLAIETRKRWAKEYWNDYEAKMRREPAPQRAHVPDPTSCSVIDLRPEHCPRCGVDWFWCNCMAGGFVDISTVQSMRVPKESRGGIVELVCDRSAEQNRPHNASEDETSRLPDAPSDDAD